MSELAFLSPALAEVGYRSPLERALAGRDLDDLSALGKLEVRGDVAAVDGGEVLRIAPRRTLVLCDPAEAPALATRLRAGGTTAVDMSAALAGLAVRGPQLMRRLTDLDLESLPAVGAVAGVQCTVVRDGEQFRLFFAQEYADHVAAVVVDAAEGLR